MTVVGSKKMVVYDDMLDDAKISVYDKGIDKKHIDSNMGRYDNYEKFLLIHRSGDIMIPKIKFEEPLRIETGDFIRCVRERKTPVTDGRNGLEVTRVLEAASRSLNSNGKVIEV
jgi:predicted dehydrogenase